MLIDLANQFNPPGCQADFNYSITPKAVQIQDTGKGKKAVVDDLEAVLRKIENWHQGSIAGYWISFRDAPGVWYRVGWDGQEASVYRA